MELLDIDHRRLVVFVKSQKGTWITPIRSVVRLDVTNQFHILSSSIDINVL